MRASTSISLDCSAVKRSFAESGEYLTLVGSLKIAAAIARQKSTSRPVQLPLSSGLEKPGRPWLTPQMSEPRSFTVLRVWAGATEGLSLVKRCRSLDCLRPRSATSRPEPLRGLAFVLRRHLRTIAPRGQGVDGSP